MTSVPERVPVLVVGGGPSGLAAAIELGARGIEVIVVEPRSVLDPLRPRAKTTSVRTMEHLRRWGIAGRLRTAAPLPVSHAQDVVFVTGLFGHEITRFEHAFGLWTTPQDIAAEAGQQAPQPLVEEVLREACADLPTVTMLVGWRATTVVDGPDQVHAVLQDPDGVAHDVAADYLLGCDGSSGVIRSVIGVRYEGASGTVPNLSITFRSRALEERDLCALGVHYWVIGAKHGGLMGRLDLDGTWWAIVQGIDDDVADVDAVALVRSLVGDDIDVEVLATDPWSARMLLVDRYRGERVFLVGDAAHLNPPWGGHGFNTCVGDAVNLGWKLAGVLQGWAREALLDSYEAERRPVAQRTIAAAGGQEAFLAPSFAAAELDADGPAGEAMRAEVARALQVKDPEFHSLGLVLGYDYRSSPVVASDGPAPPEQPVNTFEPSAHPGARLPHAWLPDGTSVYDLLGNGFTLVRFGPTADVAALSEAAARLGVPLRVLDLTHVPRLRTLYGADLVLVRPDQHIAWRDAVVADPVGLLRHVVGAADRPDVAASAKSLTTCHDHHHRRWETPTMQTRHGTMATERPGRYAKQLAGHWARKGSAGEEDGATVIRFETGQVVRMWPETGRLHVQASVPDDGDPDRFAQVVKDHLERFGQREELDVVWDAPAGDGADRGTGGDGIRALPEGFLLGVATAGHQNEGQNTNSDTWFLEHTTPSVFREPSGRACNGYELWREDLDLVAAMGLDAYRFSVEWARVEPSEGTVDEAALDHYEAMVDRCVELGLAPVVTFNHFTAPHWFAAEGGWLSPRSADLFARYCGWVMDRFGDRIAYAVTLNEPNLPRLLSWLDLPAFVHDLERATLEAASAAAGVERYRAGNVMLAEDMDAIGDGMTAGHRAARAAIKARRPDLPVGFSLAVVDDRVVGDDAGFRDRKRQEVYARWLELAREDDFLGIQNYESRWYDSSGEVPPAPGTPVNGMGSAVEPTSLAGAVRYAHAESGVPILVTEHGMQTPHDNQRADFIEPSLAGLLDAMGDGVPVLGYLHWTLMDNFEWIFGYGAQLGLHEVDRETFVRTPKRSAQVYAGIARARCVRA